MKLRKWKKGDSWEWMDDDSWENVEETEGYEKEDTFEEREFDPDEYVAELLQDQDLQEYLNLKEETKQPQAEDDYDIDYEEETDEYISVSHKVYTTNAQGEANEYSDEAEDDYDFDYEEETDEYLGVTGKIYVADVQEESGEYPEEGEEAEEFHYETETDEYIGVSEQEYVTDNAYEEEECKEEAEESYDIYYEDEDESVDVSNQADDIGHQEEADEYLENSYDTYEGTEQEETEEDVEEGEENYEEDADEYAEYYAEDLVFKKKKGQGSWLDYVIMFAGGIVVLLAVVMLGYYVKFNKNGETENRVLQNVGKQLEDVNMIGEKGLLAMSDAQKAVQAMSQMPEPTPTPEATANPEYNEEDYSVSVKVKLSFTSIEKDLKIKFLNDSTGKLVGNVPFAVEAVGEDGKTYFWSDDDMDGIIYKKNLTAGMYTIKLQELKEERYRTYGIPTEENKVEVKSNIVYEKVDVTAEIKTESQVDVKKEDTKINNTIKEEYLKDTVTWVESTASEGDYEEIKRENIPDPLTLVASGSFIRLSGGNGDFTMPEATLAPILGGMETPVPEATPTPGSEVIVPILPEATPTPVPEATPTPVPEETASPAPEMMTVSFEQKTATVYTSGKLELGVTITNKKEGVLLSAESTDTGVATVSVENEKVIVTGVSAGTVTVTVTAQVANAGSTSDTCTVEVTQNPQVDNDKTLVDDQGRDVYVYENDAYRPATYADYYTASKFFVKKDAKYTGWQTINGQKKYYDATGKSVTGEQIIQGVKYNFTNEGVLVTGSGVMGIDVSKWNGNIDWKAVKEADISYVIIRCGYRGSSKGNLIEDSKFKENIKGATNAGLKVGVYFFTQAINKSEALEEASMVLECVKNYQISYPIFLDVEPGGGRADSIDVATRTEVCKTFCETIKKYNYTPGIYANKNWLESKLNMNELGGYKIWLAQYASEPTYQGRYDMWQYKDTGKVNGISGNVDLNMSYLGY